MPCFEDLFVGGGDVGMGAERGRDASVEIASQELLVAGRLGVNVDDDDARVAADLFEDPVAGPERAIDRLHERSPQNGEDGDHGAVAGLDQ